MAKRRHKVRKPKPKLCQPSTKMWPVIWCSEEDICIGVSKVCVGAKSTRKLKKNSKIKVDHSQWKDWNSKFREGYDIDLERYSKGDLVACPHCGSSVDFRLFPSRTYPEMTDVTKLEDKIDNA